MTKSRKVFVSYEYSKDDRTQVKVGDIISFEDPIKWPISSEEFDIIFKYLLQRHSVDRVAILNIIPIREDK